MCSLHPDPKPDSKFSAFYVHSVFGLPIRRTTGISIFGTSKRFLPIMDSDSAVDNIHFLDAHLLPLLCQSLQTFEGFPTAFTSLIELEQFDATSLAGTSLVVVGQCAALL